MSSNRSNSPVEPARTPTQPIVGRRWLALLAAAVPVFTLWLLVYPLDFASPPSGFLEARQVHKINTASNVLLFVPLGLMVGWLAYVRRGGVGVGTVVLAVCGAGVVSAAGEAAQMWLPQRESSLVDWLANMAGGGVGAVAAVAIAPALTARWQRAGRWLSGRSAARRAVIVVLLVLAVRTAPFDLSLEIDYLKESLLHDTRGAGGPFAQTRRWLNEDRPASDGALWRAARGELVRASANAALFALAAFHLARAGREAQWRRRRRGRATGAVLGLAVLLLLGSELLQWPIRSRLMDATDAMAGLIGIAMGLILDSIRPGHADG